MTIEQIKARMAALLDERDALRAEAESIRTRAADATATVSPADLERASAITARRAAIDTEADQLFTQLAAAEDESRRDARAATMRVALGTATPDAGLRTTGGGVVTHEARTYSKDSSRRGTSFFGDAYALERGGAAGAAAKDRLERHAMEMAAEGETLEERATTTTSFAGLIVPQYLTEQAALLARAGRPVANTAISLELPDQGMQFLIPRGTTGAGTAIQATENASVQNTDEVWANVTIPVATIAGQQDISRQSLERGVPGIDQLVYMDLAGAYAVNLDSQVISGTGSSGQVLGIQNTAGINQATAFTAAATPTTFYSKMAGQLAAIETTRFLPPTVIAMHPRRWNWLVAQVDTAGRPLVVPNANIAFNPMAVQDSLPDYGRVVGTMQGLPVITDANLPTAVGTGPEDIVFVYRAEDLLLWEDGDGMPRQLRFEQTLGNQLTIKLVVYGYVAFTAGRYPTAVGVVGGNAGTAGFGLAAPTF